MTDILKYSIGGVLLFILELVYFKVADHFNIIDKPNQRSSHTIPTIRGGGVIFLFAILLWFVSFDFRSIWLIVAAILIAVVSFLDDLGEQPAKIRLSIHLIAFVIMGWQAGLINQPIWISLVMLIVSIGTVNAFNFMDGINGITGVYSLVSLSSLLLINQHVSSFTDGSMIIFLILGVVVFLYFNFRKKARCFAGDVGSVTLAFLQVFLLIQLILTTGNYGWILIFLVYGVDSVVTIIYRLSRRENIFKAHRSHLYQYFSNELRMPHLTVSIIYGVIQVVINLALYFALDGPGWLYLLIAGTVGIIYVFVREITLKKIGHKGLILR